MGLIEAILQGIQMKNLKKPNLFFSMLLGFTVFTAFGLALLLAAFQGLLGGATLGPGVMLIVAALLFFGLSVVCAHFIKRCF
ncbi:MAG: hypothetical protein AAGI44_07490 [Pseudomonadota bacterium]